MQTLSRVLVELYDLAELAPIQRYPAQAIATLRQLVDFDGAMLGKGDTDPIGSERAASSHQDDGQFIHESHQITACRALSACAAADLVTAECSNCNRKLLDADESDFNYQECHSVKIILSGSLAKYERGDWLMLCRTNGKKFEAEEKKYLQAVWPHVMRGLAINRRRFLEMQRKQLDDCAVALMSAEGCIKVADSYFNDVLSVEWPAYAGEKLPEAALECWKCDRPYIGTRIEINFRQQAGNLFCIARPYLVLAGLTKTEHIVAQYFASGLNHKEVAQTLGVSQNTVRTHLKQTYSKLGIHDKAQLANRFASAPGRQFGAGRDLTALPGTKQE